MHQNFLTPNILKTKGTKYTVRQKKKVNNNGGDKSILLD